MGSGPGAPGQSRRDAPHCQDRPLGAAFGGANRERQLLLLGSYSAFTAGEQNVRRGISLPFPLPENSSPTPCKT